MVSRDALSRHHVDDDVDLLISVGGDGTVLVVRTSPTRSRRRTRGAPSCSA